MLPIENRVVALTERLAHENRCLLALLALGYTLAQAERALRGWAGRPPPRPGRKVI